MLAAVNTFRQPLEHGADGRRCRAVAGIQHQRLVAARHQFDRQPRDLRQLEHRRVSPAFSAASDEDQVWPGEDERVELLFLCAHIVERDRVNDIDIRSSGRADAALYAQPGHQPEQHGPQRTAHAGRGEKEIDSGAIRLFRSQHPALAGEQAASGHCAQLMQHARQAHADIVVRKAAGRRHSSLSDEMIDALDQIDEDSSGRDVAEIDCQN
jgi:hypothetical protein